MEELIAKRYAKALTSASTDVAGASEVLNVLSSAISNPEVETALNSPIVKANEKTEMILSVLGDNADKTLMNFIKILGENKRLDLIPAIAKVLNADLQKISNKYEGVLFSKNALDDTALSNLEGTLQKYTGSTINLTQEKSELEGLHVAVEDLGIEVNFSKKRVKEQLIDFIKKSL